MEQSAFYLSETQWGPDKDNPNLTGEPLPRGKVTHTPLNINPEEMQLDELQAAIRQLKRNKSGGPDQPTVELFKHMDEKGHLLHDFREWGRDEKIDQEALRAEWYISTKKETPATWPTTGQSRC